MARLLANTQLASSPFLLHLPPFPPPSLHAVSSDFEWLDLSRWQTGPGKCWFTANGGITRWSKGGGGWGQCRLMPGHRSAGNYVRLLNQHYVEIFMRNLSLNEGGHNKGKVFTFLFNIFRVFPPHSPFVRFLGLLLHLVALVACIMELVKFLFAAFQQRTALRTFAELAPKSFSCCFPRSLLFCSLLFLSFPMPF